MTRGQVALVLGVLLAVGAAAALGASVGGAAAFVRRCVRGL